MPSLDHETLLNLFQNNPALAPELLREALHAQIPDYTDVCINSADLTDIQPAEYRADLVIILAKKKPVLGIVFEVQISPDKHKRYAWPAYVVNLRARLRCPVCLLVLAADEAVARWASKPVELGGESRFVPWVLRPSAVPEITDIERAKEYPELAVLSVIAHAEDPDTEKVKQIGRVATKATRELDPERSMFYYDLIQHYLPEAARQALQSMDMSKYEYKSEFARRYFGQGETEGRIKVVLKQLATRFGALSATVEARIRGANSEELDSFAERVLTARTLEEALGVAL